MNTTKSTCPIHRRLRRPDFCNDCARLPRFEAPPRPRVLRVEAVDRDRLAIGTDHNGRVYLRQVGAPLDLSNQSPYWD